VVWDTAGVGIDRHSGAGAGVAAGPETDVAREETSGSGDAKL